MPRKSSPLPASLSTVRVILYVLAALSGLWVIGLLAGYGVTSENIGGAIVQLVPAVTSALVARNIRDGGRTVRRWNIGLQIVGIVFALSRIGQADLTGILGLILPITVLVLVARAEARRYLS